MHLTPMHRQKRERARTQAHAHQHTYVHAHDTNTHKPGYPHLHLHTHVDVERQRPGSRVRGRWGARPGVQKSATTKVPASSRVPKNAKTVPVTRSDTLPTLPSAEASSLRATRPLYAYPGQASNKAPAHQVSRSRGTRPPAPSVPSSRALPPT